MKTMSAPKRTRPPSGKSAGFTLLEAIVAIAIIGLTLLPLVSYISLASSQLQRSADANEQSIVTQSVLALMTPVNPLLEPDGQLPLDRDIKIAWKSETLVQPNTSALLGAGLAGYRLGFYKVHVTVSRADASEWFTFDLRKVGYDRFTSAFDPFTTLNKK